MINFFNQLKLAHKGLILVAVPLVFQLIFIFTLTGLLKQADSELEHEAKSRQVIASTNNLLRYMVMAGASGGEANMTHKIEYLKRFKFYWGKINGEFEKLKVLFEGENAKSKNLERVSQKANKLLKVIASTFDDYADQALEFRLLMGAKNMADSELAIEVLSNSLRQITFQEMKLKEKSTLSRKRAESNVKLAILAGLTANLLLTIALSTFFGQSISNRLKRLTLEAEKLPKRETIELSHTGNDEIAELEQELSRTAMTLHKLDQSKLALLKNVSDQLKAPLSSINERLEKLSSNSLGTLSAKGTTRFSDASISIKRLIRLIKDFLVIDKIESGSLELERDDLQFANLAQTSVSEMNALALRYGVSIETEIEDMAIYADQDRLIQVLVNLLSNAIKYSTKGGVITLKSQNLGSKLRIEVIDRGRGIPKEAALKIFQPYEQVEQADSKEKGGTGLGLAICKEIIEGHAGSIEVESVLGQGSTFRIELPQERRETLC